MKFIFPKNYKMKNHLFGFIDYSTAIFNLIWYIFVFCCLDLLFSSFSIKISLFIVFCFPLFLFSLIGFQHENILYVLFYLIKFLKNKKFYFYL